MDGDEEMTRGEGARGCAGEKERMWREGARGHSEVLLNKVEPMVLKVDQLNLFIELLWLVQLCHPVIPVTLMSLHLSLTKLMAPPPSPTGGGGGGGLGDNCADTVGDIQPPSLARA